MLKNDFFSMKRDKNFEFTCFRDEHVKTSYNGIV